jgi:2-keto-3-deoxy-L-rhamnonate aldolase RhmA
MVDPAGVDQGEAAMSYATELRRRLYAGERVYGTMAFEFFTPGLIPLLHAAGCEYVVLDMEHSGVSIETIKQQIAYARGLGIAVWVRVPELRYAALARVLDAGADGVMVPMLETAEQAKDLVRFARYRPDGERGCAFGMAHDHYRPGDPAAVMQSANQRIVLIALIETAEGIENCAAIMATPGLDVGWLGHYDPVDDALVRHDVVLAPVEGGDLAARPDADEALASADPEVEFALYLLPLVERAGEPAGLGRRIHPGLEHPRRRGAIDPLDDEGGVIGGSFAHDFLRSRISSSCSARQSPSRSRRPSQFARPGRSIPRPFGAPWAGCGRCAPARSFRTGRGRLLRAPEGAKSG